MVNPKILVALASVNAERLHNHAHCWLVNTVLMPRLKERCREVVEVKAYAGVTLVTLPSESEEVEVCQG